MGRVFEADPTNFPKPVAGNGHFVAGISRTMSDRVPEPLPITVYECR
jgi:hypothetical protein